MDNKWRFEYVNCNLCGSNNTSILYKKKGKETGFVYNIVECKHCNLVYANPRLAEQSLKNLYNEDYYRKSGWMKKPTYEERGSGIEKEGISLIESIECRKPFCRRQTFLDVGCGMGSLLYDAIKAGYKATGIEYSEDAYNYLKEQKLDVYLGAFEKIELGEKKFDVVTAIAVLEHLQDPLSFFKKVDSCLKEGGIFFYVTANFDSLISKLLGRNWSFIEPDRHLYYFTPATIISYLNKVNLKPVYLRDYFDPGRKLTRYFMMAGLIKKGQKIPQTPLEKIIFHILKLFDTVRNINMPYAIKERGR